MAVGKVQNAEELSSGAEEAAKKPGTSDENGVGLASEAKARDDSVGFMRGLKPPPPSKSSFSAACEVVFFQNSILTTGRFY
jgi:hypothetical protein